MRPTSTLDGHRSPAEQSTEMQVHTLEPLDVPVSSDQGILSALFAAGKKKEKEKEKALIFGTSCKPT